MSDPDYPVTDWMPLLVYGDDAAETNRRIVMDILSHPSELPTERELLYVLTASDDRTEDDVHTQLPVLQDAGIVVSYDHLGYTFYGLTDAAKQFVVDARLYRGHEVLKEVTHCLERTDEIQAAYETKRPKHPPAERDYDEQDWSDSDAWDAARESTYRTLTLSLERINDLTFQTRLVEEDDGTELAAETFEVESVGEWTDDYREMEVTEARGSALPDNEYGISIELDGTTYKVQPTKDGEDWYSFVERSLYVFTQ